MSNAEGDLVGDVWRRYDSKTQVKTFSGVGWRTLIVAREAECEDLGSKGVNCLRDSW